MRGSVLPAAAATILALFYVLWVVHRAGDPLTLATLGSVVVQADMADRAFSQDGYDGQFVYLLAQYGWENSVEIPAYRAQRVLLAAIGHALSFGHTDATIWVLLSINLAALFVGTWALGAALAGFGQSPWIALGFGLSLGMMGSVRLTATEPLAYGLIALSLLAIQRDRPYLAAALVGVSALARETTLIFALAYGLWWLAQRRWALMFVGGLLMGLPALLWQIVLVMQYGQPGISSGGPSATPFEVIPFMGFIRILTEGSLAAFLLLGSIAFFTTVLPALWGMWVTIRQRAWDLWGFVLFWNAALMMIVPFSTYREPMGILRFIVGLQLAVTVYAAHRGLRRPLLYSTLWALTTLFIIGSDLAAP